jgi:hypothetical protein
VHLRIAFTLALNPAQRLPIRICYLWPSTGP